MHLQTADQSSSNALYPVNSIGQGIRFIDLFAGIGGFHLALSSLGATCVFASEKDPHARATYLHNLDFPAALLNTDIRNISPDSVPDHDVLCAGFPCQPFSQAGLKKGFQDGEDSERGNLFFCIVDILEAKQPAAFILENVRHLVNHDDGKTFKIILELLDRAGYQVFYQVLKASDYNIPQNRPRVFLVGLHRRLSDRLQFDFPAKLPLTHTMSDVFGAPCEKKIGFTLRVGGKGSKIEDRRNWEFYRVNGEVRRIGLIESKKMMALPDDYHFPVSQSQAMKQLGNSVCVEVVRQVAQQLFKTLQYYQKNTGEIEMKTIKRNKGELSEIYALCKVIHQRYLNYGDMQAQPTADTVQVVSIHTDQGQICLGQSDISIVPIGGGATQHLRLDQLITQPELDQILQDIQQGVGTFSVQALSEKAYLLGMEKTKGSAYEKADLLMSFIEHNVAFDRQGTSVKSFLGNSPTLLNASQATNFIYQINGLKPHHIDMVNAIDSSAKVKDRLAKIIELGGELVFLRCENPIYEDTLRKVDSQMPEILAQGLLAFFQKRFGNRLSDYPNSLLTASRAEQVACRLKDFVKSTMLGIFPTQHWDGCLSANSVLLIDPVGQLLFYHTNKDNVLKEFFYQHTFFDTASTTRHRFGALYAEGNQLHFKLNLQLRLSQ